MGACSSCAPWGSGTAPSRRGAAADVVVKIGGSACTIKAKFETLNEFALTAISSQLGYLAQENHRIAVIHGAGSFGHYQAKQYGVSKGQTGGKGPDNSNVLPPTLKDGFARTRLSVTTLNKHIITSLLEQGLPAVAISPCPFVRTKGKKLAGDSLPSAAIEGTRGLLDRGLVPVVHGDAVIDDIQSVAILSGDIWMVQLCRELCPKSAVFVTDVDGVLTKPPSEPDAQLIREIWVKPDGELELGNVAMDCAAHDVTGGLSAKLKCAADVLLQAPSVSAVYIVRAGSRAAWQALRGEAPSEGTTLRRQSSQVPKG